MGFVGGTPAYWFLKTFYPNGDGCPMPQHDTFKERGISKLEAYFGPELFEQCRGRTVLDFGCGAGDNAIELAQRGAARVIGVDIDKARIAAGRRRVQELGLSSSVELLYESTDSVDVVISTDAVEHFEDPLGALKFMAARLKADGTLFVEFGPTWYHPLGGHLFSVFPWAHLVFTDSVLIRWRSDFKFDGMKSIDEALNRMTIARWRRLVPAAGLRVEREDLVPIKAAARFHNRLTQEFFTSIVRARLKAIS
jgi:SAM-dependent methyltransferase